jgi:hypothetical protein
MSDFGERDEQRVGRSQTHDVSKGATFDGYEMGETARQEGGRDKTIRSDQGEAVAKAQTKSSHFWSRIHLELRATTPNLAEETSGRL